MRPEPLKHGANWQTQVQSDERKGNGIGNCRATLARACQPPSGTGSIWPSIVAALLVGLICVALPTAPPYLNVEASWCAVLQWAHEHGLQFGKDIVFSYGPLGFLLAPYCLAAPSNSLVLINTLLSFQIASGLCLVARRLAPLWRYGLAGFFVLLTANAELKADLLLDTGLFCWGLLCLLESGRQRNICTASFALLAAFAALTKVVYLFVASFSVCAITLFFLLGNEGKVRWLLLPGFAAALVAAWLGSGQALAHLAPFTADALSLSRDYDQAVALGGSPTLRSWGILLGLAAGIPALLRICNSFDPSMPHVRLRRAVLLGWVGGLLLLVWKHSLVRLDRFHFFDLAVFAPVVAVALEALPGPVSPARTAGRIASLISCCLSLYIVELTFLPGWRPSLAQVFSQFAGHTRWLISPGECRRVLEPELEALRKEAQLPKVRQVVGSSTVDVFGMHQAHALLNGLNYKPRPVFQSYVAYNSQLAHLNEDLYLSQNAPDYVLFELAGVEHRFAALEDGLTLRSLLSSYVPITSENGFLLLKRNSSSRMQLRFLQQGNLEPGERLNLDSYSHKNLWLEMELKQSWWRRIWRFLYRPPPVRLSVWANSSPESKLIARRQAAGSALASGFLCSPFFLDTAVVGDFYSNRWVLRPGAISVDLGSGSEHSGDRIPFRLYQVENLAGETQAR